MPSLHHLNPPPHPFWDFVANLDDHPFFAAYAPRGPGNGNTNENVNAGQPQQADPPINQEPSEAARGKQPAADPPEVDPSTINPAAANTEGRREFPFRGRGRHHHHGPPGEGFEGRRGPGCRGRGGFPGRGGPFGHHGPPGSPFMFGPPPFWTGPRHHSHPHHRGPHREREHEGRREPAEHGFNVGDFLNNLGERLGVDLAGAAENLGLDKYSAPRTGEDVDFEPHTDIFDTATSYVIHLSLPGAKKQDVGVDWDGENSVLRITGVVHRPEVDEQMLAQLVVNGRKRENGVFEKAIRLGTKRDPASVDVGGITAKMTDGVLVVRVPKVEREVHKREVPISGSASPSPARNEQDLLFDADEEMYDAAPQTREAPTPAAEQEKSTPPKSKEEEDREDRSVTAGREEEQLPAYATEQGSEKMSDWEKDSDEEADYVKINVD